MWVFLANASKAATYFLFDLVGKETAMVLKAIIALLGGVALFLFGMMLMGDGLKKVAGNKMEMVLWKLSNNTLKSVLLGTAVTAVIQSSSATSVMVVGFVNSSIMKLTQAIGIVMGANLGTSITGVLVGLSLNPGGGNGWVSLLSSATLAACIAMVGIILRMFCKDQTKKHVGDILLGFAILMYGLSAMSSAVSPLKENAVFQSMMTSFQNPLLAIPVGVLFSAILQSASAAVGVMQGLAADGDVMTFAGAFPLILGIGVGASLPVLLSAIGANKNGKRTALIYLLVNVLGVIVIGGLFYVLNAICHFGFMDSYINHWGIAGLNALYRAANLIILIPFVKPLEKLVRKLIKDDPKEEEDNADFERLEERFIANPSLAIEQSRLALNSMAEKSQRNLFRSMDMLYDFNQETFDLIQEKEDVIDRYEDKLGTYLIKLTSLELSEAQSREVSKILHTMSDFERIGDHAVNLADNATELHQKSIRFSEEAIDELGVLHNAVQEIVNISVESFTTENVEMAYRVEPLEEMIDLLCDEIKMHHISRIQRGECTFGNGFVFNDILTNYERIADHCSNIAVALIELQSTSFDTHEYLNSLKKAKDHSFAIYFDEYKEKYSL